MFSSNARRTYGTDLWWSVNPTQNPGAKETANKSRIAEFTLLYRISSDKSSEDREKTAMLYPCICVCCIFFLFNPAQDLHALLPFYLAVTIHNTYTFTYTIWIIEREKPITQKCWHAMRIRWKSRIRIFELSAFFVQRFISYYTLNIEWIGFETCHIMAT